MFSRLNTGAKDTSYGSYWSQTQPNSLKEGLLTLPNNKQFNLNVLNTEVFTINEKPFQLQCNEMITEDFDWIKIPVILVSLNATDSLHMTKAVRNKLLSLTLSLTKN